MNWRLTVFSLACCSSFVWLGFWQWERADEKDSMMVQDQAMRNQAPTRIADVVAPADGQPVLLVGEYQPQTVFLLDNRVLEGTVGFEVLVPFRDRSGGVVIVNRGFVPMARTRADMPSIPDPARHGTALGNIYISSVVQVQAHPFQALGQARIVQEFAAAAISERLGETVYPHLVRLSEVDPNALPRFWPVTVMSSARHRGYSVQWFMMALAVVVAWSVFTFRRTRDNPGGAV